MREAIWIWIVTAALCLVASLEWGCGSREFAHCLPMVCKPPAVPTNVEGKCGCGPDFCAISRALERGDDAEAQRLASGEDDFQPEITSAQMPMPDSNTVWTTSELKDDSAGTGTVTFTTAPTLVFTDANDGGYVFWIKHGHEDMAQLISDTRCISFCTASKQGCREICDE